MLLNSPTFVLQRRINRPLGAVERVLCDPKRLRAGTELALAGDRTVMTLDDAFGVTFPPFGLEGASWLAHATVRTRRRRIARLDIEINEWDPGSTELVVRPRARRPWRWGRRRLREYFRVAHLTADALTQVLGSRPTSAPTPATDPTNVATVIA